MWDKSKNQFCYRLSNKQRPKVRFSEISKKRLRQKCFTPRNNPKSTKIAFQIFVNFGLFSRLHLNLFHTANKFLKIDQFY
ncbi:hypothetical protein IGI47_001638 [Enterococcus sp. AZ191]